MKKTLLISLVFFLILSTAIIKNSTKKIDEDIFVLEENLRILKDELGNLKLEFEFLSSSERLLNFQKSYFDDELIQKDIKTIKQINTNYNQIKIKKKITSDDEK